MRCAVTPNPARRDRCFRSAVGVMFALHGVAAGSWAVRIPWVAEMHRLSSGELGLALFGAAAFSAAGAREGPDRGTSVAAVATVGYGGWLAAPALIGLVASATSLTISLALVAALTAIIAIAAGALRR